MLRTHASRVVRDSGYVLVIALIPGLERITQFWFGNEDFFRGHSVSFWTTYALAGVSLMLWIFARRDDRLSNRAYIVPVLLAAISIYTLARLIVDDELFNLKALVLFLVIFLITIKPPRFEIARQASIVLGLGVILAAAASLATTLPNLTPTGFNPGAFIGGRFLAAFGIGERWEGPFGNVNYASIAGGMTVLLAFLARGPLRWFMCVSGLAMALLAQGRAAMVAMVAGLLVLALWSRRLQGSPTLRRLRVGALAALVTVFGILTTLSDFSGSGRTYIWQDYLALGTQSPLFGVGNPGIREYIEGYQPEYVQLGSDLFLLPAFDHGHSIYIDQWARGGVLGLLLVVCVIAAIGLFSWHQANRGLPYALAMVTFAALSGAFETTITWNYLSVLYAPIFVAWILSLELRPRGTSPSSTRESLSKVDADPLPQ